MTHSNDITNAAFSAGDELLGGLSIQRVKKQIQLIEGRTAYFIRQIQLAIEILFKPSQQSAEETEGASYLQIVARDLERFAPLWADLVPDDPDIKATIAYVFSRKYHLDYDHIPAIRAALNLDSEAVQEAFTQRYNATPQAVLQTDSPPTRRITRMVWLEEAIAADIEDQLEWVYLRRGDYLFHQGDPGDALFVVANGHVQVVMVDGEKPQVIGERGRGEIIGEMAVLTDDPRSASVVAARDTELIRFSKEKFHSLAEKYPAVMLRLAQMIVDRMRAMMRPHLPRRAVKTVAVLPLEDTPATQDFIKRLAAQLERHGPTLHLTPGSLDHHLFNGAAEALGEDITSRTVVTWLNEQEAHYTALLFEADKTNTVWTQRCLQQADKLLLVAEASSDPALRPLETDVVAENVHNLGVELVLLHPDKSKRPTGTHHWLEPREVERHHHVPLHNDDGVARVARHLLAKSIGLVFSGGVARAFAYVGVLRAFRDLDIPVDVVGATSAGSYAATVPALDLDLERTVEISLRLMDALTSDYTLPLVSIMAGRKYNTTLKKFVGDIQIEDLWVPFVCVSTNTTRAELHIHDQGSLRRAIRASTSLPGILPPVLANRETYDLLVDGAVLNNLPVDIVGERCNGIVIAADVSNRVARVKEYNFDDSVSGFALLLNRLNPFRKRRLRAPSLGKFLSRLTIISSVREKDNQLERADIIINPMMDDFSFFDASQHREMADAGYQEARSVLEAWLAEQPDLVL